MFRTALLAIELRLVTDGNLCKVDERVNVTARVIFADKGNEERKQHLLVYRHEEGREVETTYPCFGGVVFADADEFFFEMLHGSQCAKSLAAIKRHIAMVVESFFK